MRFVGRIVGGIVRGISLLWQICVCGVANLVRRLSKGSRADYVLFELSGPLLERTPQRPRFLEIFSVGKPAPSVEFLHDALRKIAGDPDVRGVVFLVKGAQLSLAQAQTVADLFERFRGWNRALYPAAKAKEVVVFLETCGNAEYVMAAAADRICVSPLTDWMVLGLRAEPVFLAETLRRIGVEAEVVKVAPWKTAADSLARSEISDAHREQIERLLDSWYGEMVAAISEGRDIGEEQVRAAIDRAPLTADEVVALGLVDDVIYEDQLANALGGAKEEARILAYDQARGSLYRRPRRRHRKRIGVISLSGMITTGKSRRFPPGMPIVGGSTAGSTTVQQLIRAAMKDERLAGVVLHVDSRGGSALASDLIWRELTLLNGCKPVVTYMGDVAASGGYYVALPGQKIVCQAATVTGSIGVIMAKLVTSEAFGKVGARRFPIQRGENADIYADDGPWRQEQREKVEEQIDYTYRTFKRLVAEGRQLEPTSLEELCGGRVWTGRQAQMHGLVDEIGDFATAIDRVCEIAELPTDGTVPVVQVKADQNRPRPPISEGSLEVTVGGESLGELTDALLAVLQGDVSALLGRERVWMLADGLPKSR
ncbi:MAG: signal peptide peptidase SppA [Caldilineaceae bacterium]|nr:signal peptide peptidase SppA [Caldilineaceae bacterium]